MDKPKKPFPPKKPDVQPQPKKADPQPPPPKPPEKPAPVTIVPPEVVPPADLPIPEAVRAPESVVATSPARMSPGDEIAALEKRIASDQARLLELQHPRVEFPKIVNGRRFETREEQDKAGSDFADKK